MANLNSTNINGNLSVNGKIVVNGSVLDTDITSGAENIEDGTGTKAIKQSDDTKYTAVAVKSKNPNAYVLDNTITDSEPIGASGDYASAFGGNTSAKGKRAMSQGTATLAKGNYSHAEGDNSVAIGVESHAEGYTTVAYGNRSHSEGDTTIAKGVASHAEGSGSQSNGINSHAEGRTTIADGNYSHTEGDQTSTKKVLPTSSTGGSGGSGGDVLSDPDDWNVQDHIGENAHAEGCHTNSYGYTSHAEGYYTNAYGHYSHTEGAGTYTGNVSNGTITGGLRAHAEGFKTHASGNNSHAEGTSTQASGDNSHAEGSGTVASGVYAHAQGLNTTASGIASTVGGLDSSAIGDRSFVHGIDSTAKGHAQTALGIGITADETSAPGGVFVGQYNKSAYNAIFEVGNGTSSNNRSTALDVLYNGTVRVPGTLTTGALTVNGNSITGEVLHYDAVFTSLNNMYSYLSKYASYTATALTGKKFLFRGTFALLTYTDYSEFNLHGADLTVESSSYPVTDYCTRMCMLTLNNVGIFNGYGYKTTVLYDGPGIPITINAKHIVGGCYGVFPVCNALTITDAYVSDCTGVSTSTEGNVMTNCVILSTSKILKFTMSACSTMNLAGYSTGSIASSSSNNTYNKILPSNLKQTTQSSYVPSWHLSPNSATSAHPITMVGVLINGYISYCISAYSASMVIPILTDSDSVPSTAGYFYRNTTAHISIPWSYNGYTPGGSVNESGTAHGVFDYYIGTYGKPAAQANAILFKLYDLASTAYATLASTPMYTAVYNGTTSKWTYTNNIGYDSSSLHASHGHVFDILVEYYY